MNVSGTRSFAARREVVWRILNDPQAMAELMPGVERFEVRDDRHWIAHVKIPLGLGGLRMSINFDKLEEREPEFARLRAKGTGVGALMDMETQFHLEEAEGGTNMRWAADVNIAGPVGSMGQRVLQPIVNQQVAMVLNALDEQVQRASAAVEPPPVGTEPAAAVSPGTTLAAADQPAPDAVYMGATPGSTEFAPGPGHAAGGDVGEASGPSTGDLGTPEPTTEMEPPPTDPELKDAGPPADVDPEADPAAIEGSSGAEEGINPWAPQAYNPDAETPTTSTEGPPASSEDRPA